MTRERERVAMQSGMLPWGQNCEYQQHTSNTASNHWIEFGAARTHAYMHACMHAMCCPPTYYYSTLPSGKIPSGLDVAHADNSFL